ncbi:pyruvate,water dikinase [Larkinella arboricola]|uniref:Prodigiosin synthesizing transferase PigC n=2 Tax=Larkinella arboricola TaxID=643671 RepID=A0A327WGG6_LARAB|nr:pyruvate,water dikinase [Larkinella arboricola]
MPDNAYTLTFGEINKTDLALVGGKGANLGELMRMNGVEVPDGFCLTTEAYKQSVTSNAAFEGLFRQLSTLKSDDRKAISEIGQAVRNAIEQTPIPEPVIDEIREHLNCNDALQSYAIRSSATAEDLPDFSFAGQHDTYLNIIGEASILNHVRKCWASLFTDRAIVYRLQNKFDPSKVYLSVVVQKMVFPDTAGIMFTANPLNGNRKVVTIDAGFGLGEALVSGLVSADNYTVRDGKIVDKRISSKTRGIYASLAGGTTEQEITADQINVQALEDEQILRLARIGRAVESHFGSPQDIEWCLANDIVYLLQTRPITNLYPVPKVDDQNNHVFISVGHQQMMTDPMKPLGLSLWQLRAARPMFEAAGRLFVDVADSLATPAGRANLLSAMEQHDPLIKEALIQIIKREDFIKAIPDEGNIPTLVKAEKHMVPEAILSQVGNGPEIVAGLIEDAQKSLETLKKDIIAESGIGLFDFIVEDIRQSRQMIFHTQHMGVLIAAMNASTWLNEKMLEWLGEKNVADVLTQSVSNNITSQMGLELLDLADVIRPYGEIIEYLQQVKTNNFLDELLKFPGGQDVQSAIAAFLEKYGMRCAGEIDITKTRWSENPLILLPLILTNIKNFEYGAARQKFEKGLQQALKKEETLLERLKNLPDGAQKVKDTKAMIELLRNFAGYREYPKYIIVSRFFVYKQALLKEAKTLLEAGVISEIDDIFYLTFEEFRELVHTHMTNTRLINQRKKAFESYQRLTPPRVITSEGEVVWGNYNHESLPPGAIPGLGVSSGVVEGRARVILNMENADLEDGDILVTSFTDPSWTPLFLSIKGLVTEVGGLMTHGAVIAREYGLPAVVGVENATRLIKDGQKIRVNGVDGIIEILY